MSVFLSGHRGYRVMVKTFPSGKGHRIEVIVKWSRGGELVDHLLEAPPANWLAKTEEEAKAYGEHQARTWIDSHG